MSDVTNNKDTSVRKPRVKKSAAELWQIAKDEMRKANLEEAKLVLNSVNEYTSIKDSSEKVSKYLGEAKELNDNFKDRENRLLENITKLRNKHAVAVEYRNK